MELYYKILLLAIFMFCNISFPQNKVDSVLISKKGACFFGPGPAETDSLDENYAEAYADFFTIQIKLPGLLGILDLSRIIFSKR